MQVFAESELISKMQKNYAKKKTILGSGAVEFLYFPWYSKYKQFCPRTLKRRV